MRNAGGRSANLVGSNSADDADEDSDEHANDKADDDHELIVLRRRGKGGDGGQGNKQSAVAPASTLLF